MKDFNFATRSNSAQAEIQNGFFHACVCYFQKIL